MIVPVEMLITVRNKLHIIDLSALKVVENFGFRPWKTCGKEK
jgi:hypothetical protein